LGVSFRNAIPEGRKISPFSFHFISLSPKNPKKWNLMEEKEEEKKFSDFQSHLAQ
jgi:hypothetical protein